MILILLSIILLSIPLVASHPMEPIASSFEEGRQAAAAPGSPHHLKRNEHLLALRDDISKKWAEDLSRDASFWFFMAKLCDSSGQLCMFASPILSAVGASINDKWLVVTSSIVGVAAVAIHRFGRYASNESQGRMAALNRIFVREGVVPTVVVGEEATNTSNE